MMNFYFGLRKLIVRFSTPVSAYCPYTKGQHQWHFDENVSQFHSNYLKLFDLPLIAINIVLQDCNRGFRSCTHSILYFFEVKDINKFLGIILYT